MVFALLTNVPTPGFGLRVYFVGFFIFDHCYLNIFSTWDVFISCSVISSSNGAAILFNTSVFVLSFIEISNIGSKLIFFY